MVFWPVAWVVVPVCGVVRASAVVSGPVVVEVVVSRAVVVEIGVVVVVGVVGEEGEVCMCFYPNQGEFSHLSVVEVRPNVTKIQRVVCLCPRSAFY